MYFFILNHRDLCFIKMSRLARLRKQNEQDRESLVHFNEKPSRELMERIYANKNVWREQDDSVRKVFRQAATSLYFSSDDPDIPAFDDMYQKILIRMENRPTKILIDQTGVLYFVSGMKLFLEHLLMVAGMAGGTYKNSAGEDCDRPLIKKSIRDYAIDVYRSIQRSYNRSDEISPDSVSGRYIQT